MLFYFVVLLLELTSGLFLLWMHDRALLASEASNTRKAKKSILHFRQSFNNSLSFYATLFL